MISGANSSCFENGSQMVSSLDQANSLGGGETHLNDLLCSLSILKDKVHQVQSLVSVFISPDQGQPESAAAAIASMGTLIQEMIVTASSMMFICQQMAFDTTTTLNNNSDQLHLHQQQVIKAPNGGLPPITRGDGVVQIGEESSQGFFTGEPLEWYGDNYDNNNKNKEEIEQRGSLDHGVQMSNEFYGLAAKNYVVIELDAADLLAKYTHYCQICSKGFKRDANLRMHMRAHGDEYKSSDALKNRSKGMGCKEYSLPRKYSCPQEGCRWNKKHVKFHPLKSMICVKNHYKRSHCPKMYVCNRCNQKQFSVLSDLRTHEKHCGDLKWQCSCGTTFSRKDKLLGHVALFIGHNPSDNFVMESGKVDCSANAV